MDKEEWKDIVGYESLYKISSKGVVKKFYRNGKTRILVNQKDAHGYLVVKLHKFGITFQTSIHRLVALHFIPNPNKKHEVNHINGIKTDLSLQNLEWVTAQENIKHAFMTGLNKGPRGERQHCHKLTEQDVRDIRKLSSYLSHRKIAKIYNVAHVNIDKIIDGRNWKHVL